MPKSPKKSLVRTLTCNSLSEPLLKKYGWDSCMSCSLSRAVPDRLRKYDSRRCNRFRDGKPIKVKICSAINESRSPIIADLVEGEKENLSTPHPSAAPLAYTPSNQRIGRDYQKQSTKWWTEHREFVNRLKEENQASTENIAILRNEIDKLHQENMGLKVELSHLKQELFNAKAKLLKAEDIMECNKSVIPMIHKETRKPERLAMIGSVIVAVLGIIMRKTQAVSRLFTLCEVIFDNNLFGAIPTERVLNKCTRMYCRRHVYLPWKVLQALDLSINGGINYNGLEALRRVEGLRDYERGILPSRSSVQRCAKELHELGQELIPVKKVQSELGEMFQFDYEKMVRFILRAFSLHEIAQRERVELCITLDGAELTKDLCHLTFGIKVTDSRAIDPRDGCPLAYSEDGVFGNLFRVQSRNYCFILKSLVGKDSKQAYREFADVFKFFDNLMANGLPLNNNGPRIMPLIIWSPQDLSSIWKCLNTGSGARKHGDSHWCHLCPCTGNKIGFYCVDQNRFVNCHKALSCTMLAFKHIFI